MYKRQDTHHASTADKTDDDSCQLNFRVPLIAADGEVVQQKLDDVAALNGGLITLANEDYNIEGGFKASVFAKPSANSVANLGSTLLNSYAPAIVRLLPTDRLP